jgi:hypothetical protein
MLTLSQFFQSCSTLPDVIETYESEEAYRKEFVQMFTSQQAKKVSRLVYAFVCKKNIPRVIGESNIIYIGRTVQCLEARYWPFPVYYYIELPVIELYGPVSFAYLVMDTTEALEKAESDLLKAYYEQHMELPPKNSQGYGAWGALPNEL